MNASQWRAPNMRSKWKESKRGRWVVYPLWSCVICWVLKTWPIKKPRRNSLWNQPLAASFRLALQLAHRRALSGIHDYQCRKQILQSFCARIQKGKVVGWFTRGWQIWLYDVSHEWPYFARTHHANPVAWESAKRPCRDWWNVIPPISAWPNMAMSLQKSASGHWSLLQV